MVPRGRQVPEAGVRHPETGRQVLEEGGRERPDNSSSDSSLISSSNSGGSPTSKRAGGQSNKVAVEDLVQN